jgi:hypothetical protein
METMSDMFEDDLLSVIVHWQDEHPGKTIWFIDYGEMVLALAYPVASVWPLTGASAIRRYYPEQSALIDSDDSNEDILFMLRKLSEWCLSKTEFSGMETDRPQSVVFQVDEEGFEYNIFEFMTLH